MFSGPVGTILRAFRCRYGFKCRDKNCEKSEHVTGNIAPCKNLLQGKPAHGFLINERWVSAGTTSQNMKRKRYSPRMEKVATDQRRDVDRTPPSCHQRNMHRCAKHTPKSWLPSVKSCARVPVGDSPHVNEITTQNPTFQKNDDGSENTALVEQSTRLLDVRPRQQRLFETTAEAKQPKFRFSSSPGYLLSVCHKRYMALVTANSVTWG